MKTYQAQLQLKETYVDSIYGCIFEGWMTGAGLNVFGELAHTHCAMTSTQAIAYKCEVEKRAFEWSSAQKFSKDGQPVDAEINIDVVYDFLQ